MKLRRRQRGFWPAVAILGSAAIGALSSRASSRESRLASEAANEAARQNAEQQVAYQREFAQHGLQWRAADARAAGVHPVYAMGATGASYQPVQQAFYQDTSRAQSWRDFGNIASRALTQAADYYSRDASRQAELYGPPDYLNDPYAVQVNSIAPQGQEIASTLHPYYRAPVDQGMVSNAEKPSMAYWSVPEIGRVIAPDASNFSESLEGLESPMGQALVLYLNRHLGKQALQWLWSQMKPLMSFSRAVELARSFAESKGVIIRRE